jgi:protein-disulfide isomerase
MFSRMKRLLLVCLLVVGCRPADGGSQTPPNSTSKTPTSARSSDAARADSLLAVADAGRIQGSASAPVWIVEISDFQCPFCKRWHDEIYPTIKRDYIDKGLVRMAYVHYPLPQHPNAYPAAVASMCAALQDRFWPVHDKIFDTQTRWGAMPGADATKLFDSLVYASGVKPDSYRSCVAEDVMRRLIGSDIGRARQAQVRSTPTFFVGDEHVLGVPPLAQFRAVIERQLQKAGGKTKS